MSIKVYGADVEFMKFSAGEPHVKVSNVTEKVTKEEMYGTKRF